MSITAVALNFAEIVGAHDRIVVLREHIVQPGFVLDDVSDARTILECPFHVGDQSGHRKFLTTPFLEHLLNQRQHGILIEVSLAQVGLFPSPHFELARVLTALRVDACRRQGFQVPFAFRRIDDVHRAIAGRESLADEGEHHLVELIVGVKERTRMAAAPDFPAGQIHGSR